MRVDPNLEKREMTKIQRDLVKDIPTFVGAVLEAARSWLPVRPWFRGEPQGNGIVPLRPSLYRDGGYDENALLQFFRMRAPGREATPVPDRVEIDKWLFLAQHAGLPTRLLDWTESALAALYFAVEAQRTFNKAEGRPIVWMLNPWRLNQASAMETTIVQNEPTITWMGEHNIYHVNVRAAWEHGEGAVPLPVAVYPTRVHVRVETQASRFTVHGSNPVGISEMDLPYDCLRQIEIQTDLEEALSDLQMLGITKAALFPDTDSLAEDLKSRHRNPRRS